MRQCRSGKAGCAVKGRGSGWQVWLGQEGRAGCVQNWDSLVRQVRWGLDGHRLEWQGIAGEAGLGEVRSGMAGLVG